MVLTVRLLLLIVATILFFIASLPISTGPVNLMAAGLCLCTIAAIVT